MHRLVLLQSLLAAALCLPGAVAAAAPRANVVLIVADDLGNADLGFQGGRDVPTPRLDALAASGVRCTAGYVSGPYCSPTRAGLLTGRYQQRFGHEFNPGPPTAANVEVGLPLSERTLADVLRGAGYRTALVGKWHLGHGERYQPQSRGFDEFFGFLGGAHPYEPAGGVETGPNAIRRGREAVDEPEYLTRAFAREAVSFIERNAEGPFCLCLAFNAVHAPLEAPDGEVDPAFARLGPRRRIYASMLAELDAAVGRVLDALEAKGIADDTLVCFISDNGGPPGNASDNGPLRGYKASTWEGGVRVPFVVRWPGTLPAGTIYDRPVIQLDLFPTVLAAAGIDLPDGHPIDGVDLLPCLSGRSSVPPHERLYWRFGNQRAIRSGDWKLVEGKGIDAPILVNLAEDPSESTDVSADHPQVRRELEEAWAAWNAGLVEPSWRERAKNAAPRRRARPPALPSS